MSEAKQHEGQCFCGAIKLRVTGEAAGAGYCHCASCRSWSAGAVNAFTLWPTAQVQILSGAEHLAEFHKTDRSHRQWCKKCGGHVMTTHPGWGLIDVYAATIPSFPFKAGVHVNYEDTVLPMVEPSAERLARGPRWPPRVLPPGSIHNTGVRLALACLIVVALAGCYRTHQRGERDGGRAVDASRADARGPMPDAFVPIVRCDEVFVSQTRSLEDVTRSGVTPRLVALPGAELGLVWVSTDGDPTRVTYMRFTARLDPLGGPVTVVDDAWTWAEPAWVGDRLAIAYGRTAGEPSELSYLDAAGTRLSAVGVALPHPALMDAAGDGLLWIAFDMRAENTYVLQRLDREGRPSSPEQRILAGRYGSGHGLARLPDGAHLFGYSREGPPGVRQVYVRRVEIDGALGAELPLSDRGDSYAKPLSAGDDVVVAYGGDVLTLAELDARGTSVLSMEDAAIDAFSVVPVFVGDRVVVASFGSGGFALHDFGARGEPGSSTLPTVPLPGAPQFGHAVSLPGAAVFAVHVVRGSETFPFLVRVECRGG